jgi:REP element-mobilizing transposase RayT
MAENHYQKNRQSIRIPGYDYTQPGAYFVTLVTHDRQCLFGEIIDGRMELSPLGRIAAEQWQRLPSRFPNWAADILQIMPNHVHAVLNKNASGFVGAQRSFTHGGADSARLRPASKIKGASLPGTAPLNPYGVSDGLAQGAASPDRPCALEGSLRPYPDRSDCNEQFDRRNVAGDSLGAVVRAFKSAVTYRYQQLPGAPGHPLWQRNYYEHIVRDEDDLDRIRLYIQENPLCWSEDEDNMLRTHPG